MKEKKDKSRFQKPNSSENEPVQRSKNISNWIIFLFTISIVLINLISVVFPALIASGNSTINELREFGIDPVEINPFVRGVWTIQLIAANFLIFITIILYFKRRLPELITKTINFIFSFEISKKVSFIIMIILLGIYVSFSAAELTVEEEWEDYPAVKNRVDNWSPDQILGGFETHVRYFFIWASQNLFGYYTIIPFIASISLLLLTYFFTVEITKKRFAGIIAMVILLQSNVFLTYDSTVAYTNFWILFYLLSLYLVYRFWPLSPLSYFWLLLHLVLI